MSTHSQLPVAVIGGGPVGLAAAAHLVTRGVPVKLYEAGEIAAHVRSWGHVRLFSPWGFNTDAAATAILREHGWQAPAADVLPTVMTSIRPISNRWRKRPRCRGSSRPALAFAAYRDTASTRS